MRLPTVVLVLALALPGAAGATPQTGRVWLYGSANVQLPDGFSLSIIPGLRFEYARTDAPAKGLYLDELFVGPNWSVKKGGLGFKLSLWYYFLGYPKNGTYPLAHNLELIPTVDYQLGRLNLSLRVIFHNTFYASVYPSSQRWGFGMVMRDLVQAKLTVHESLALVLGEEPWFGLVESAGVPYSSIGYWQAGLRLNRLYVGVDWKLGEGVSLSPQYVFETSFKADGSVGEMGHYLYLTLAYSIKAI